MLAIVALLPLLVAIFLLLVLQWNVRDTGWTMLAVTVALVALVPAFSRTPWQIALSVGEGAGTMVTTGLILLPALFFYQIQWETGAIDRLMGGLARVVPDRDLQTVLLVLGVGPCIEALCGSGSGAVAILPLLVRLQGDKVKAIQLSLLSQILVAWGSLGLGTTLAANLAALPVGLLSVRTALLLFPTTIGFSILALKLSGGRPALERYWCAVLLAGSLLMGVTALCSRFVMTEVSGVLASACVIALLLVWGRLSHASSSPLPRAYANTPEMTRFLAALLPYVFLTTGILVSRLFPPIAIFLQTYGVLECPALKVHLAVLSSPGVWLLLAALLHIPLFSLQSVHLTHIHLKAWRRFLPAMAAMLSFLSAAALMQDSGMIATLGGAAAMFGEAYVWVASLVGALGGWVANTVLGGNALMVPMQIDVASHVDLSLPWLIAAQNASAAMASAISPSRIILLTTSIGLFGQEALVLRKIGPIILWSLGLMTLLLVWFTSSWWFGGVIALLVLLLVVNVPLLSTDAEPSENAGSASVPLLHQRESKSSFERLPARWMVQALAYGSLLLINVLYASFSLVSLGPLSRLDPVLFVCFQMALLAPVGLVLVLRGRQHLHRESVYRGLQLGGFLSAELVGYTLALKATGMTEAMVFSAMNGVIATLIGWKVFGQRISTLTRWACLFALGGAGLVWFTSPANWQGDFTALVSGVCLAGYAFQVERLLAEVQQRKQTVQPIIGVQFLTTALVTLVIALCFGQWKTVHLLIPSDLATLVYASFATVLLPCFLMFVVQRSLSAITVAFFSVIEPLVGASFAFFSVGERLPMLAYIGGGMVIVGILLQAGGGTIRQEASG
jgi:lactate permease